MIYCSHRPWAYVELHPKIHLAASPEYGDTTCVGLFGSLAAHGTLKTKHFWKVDTPSYLLSGIVSILQTSLFVTKF